MLLKRDYRSGGTACSRLSRSHKFTNFIDSIIKLFLKYFNIFINACRIDIIFYYILIKKNINIFNLFNYYMLTKYSKADLKKIVALYNLSLDEKTLKMKKADLIKSMKSEKKDFDDTEIDRKLYSRETTTSQKRAGTHKMPDGTLMTGKVHPQRGDSVPVKRKPRLLIKPKGTAAGKRKPKLKIRKKK